MTLTIFASLRMNRVKRYHVAHWRSITLDVQKVPLNQMILTLAI
jgi:hypothetical protein